MEIFTNLQFEDEASALIYLWSFIDDSIDLYPREMILSNGVTREELNQISIQNMKTSENVAIAVALEYLDFNVSTKGEGVLVVGVFEGSPVEGKLKKGDKIFSIKQ